MKHVVIIAHPNSRSFNGAVAASYCAAAKSLGHTALLRDLYALNFQPALTSAELPFDNGGEPGSDVVAERAVIADADIFALVYPLWLNAPPAMLKGYLERVFGYGFAYGHDGNGTRPLLTGKRLISFTTSGAPVQWVRETGAFDALRTLFDRHFAAVCGLSVVDHVHFGDIVPGIRQDAGERLLAQVGDAVRTHFA
jgi:NAD(P)H dehydrogenase (quinone)